MTSEKPRRRWFRPRYSLATLFVVVTGFGCWLGYSLNWIRQRQEIFSQRYVGILVRANMTPPRAPGLLWLFGESGYETLQYPGNLPADKAARIRQLFPEADVQSASATNNYDEEGRWVPVNLHE